MRGEYLYGVAPCTAAVSAKRRKIFEVFMKEDPDSLDDDILERYVCVSTCDLVCGGVCHSYIHRVHLRIDFDLNW